MKDFLTVSFNSTNEIPTLNSVYMIDLNHFYNKHWQFLFVRSLRIQQPMECFHMTSWRPYWCPKTMKRRPCWCPKRVLWELNSFLMQTLSFVPINLRRCWPREWKHSIECFTRDVASLSRNISSARGNENGRGMGAGGCIHRLILLLEISRTAIQAKVS